MNHAHRQRMVAQNGDSAGVEFRGPEQRTMHNALGVVRMVGRQPAQRGLRQRIKTSDDRDPAGRQRFHDRGCLAFRRGARQRRQLQHHVRTRIHTPNF